MDLNQRIIVKLESMKNAPQLSLQDSCLGDEGCRVVVDFLTVHGHQHLSKLDLKGNQIGERGVMYLS